jgi:uncharacterized membrane protein
MPESINPVIQKNIRRMLAMRQQEERAASTLNRVVDSVSRFAGSIPFVITHAVVFGLWLLINSRILPILPAWDPYPFVMLAMAASVEAIFLSTFVLITQNRQAILADKRAELDLQIGLLTEHEVTRLLQMMDELLKHHKIQMESRDLEQLKEEVAADQVLIAIEEELLP